MAKKLNKTPANYYYIPTWATFGMFLYIILMLTLTLKVTLKNPLQSRPQKPHMAPVGQSELTNDKTEISIFQGELHCGVDKH